MLRRVVLKLKEYRDDSEINNVPERKKLEDEGKFYFWDSSFYEEPTQSYPCELPKRLVSQLFMTR